MTVGQPWGVPGGVLQRGETVATGFRYVLAKGNGYGLRHLAWHGMKSCA